MADTEAKLGNFLVRVPGGGGVLEPVRVELTGSCLLVFKHDFVKEDTLANYDFTSERTVVLDKDESGFGVFIQGGIDDRSPIKVNRVPENSPAGRSGQIMEGDVILKVNGISLWGKSHHDVVELVRASGHTVTLVLASVQDKKTATGAFEDEFQPAEEPHWMLHSDIPLSFASLTKYHSGTAVLRPNAFQVLSKDGQSKVTLHCSDEVSGQMSEWITAIYASINEHSRTELQSINSLDEHDQIEMLGWVYEHVPSNIHTKIWQRKLLVIRKLKLQFYGGFPEMTEEWMKPEKSYKLVEVTVKVLKAHELVEQRANSVLLSSGTGENHTTSFETETSLVEWTQAIYSAKVNAVHHLQKQQFLARWRGQDVYFIVDINHGLSINSRTNYVQLWSKPFAWLCHSVDDGHRMLHLEFSLPNSQANELQDIELEDLQIAVCVIESFLAAKVHSLDRNFKFQTDCILR